MLTAHGDAVLPVPGGNVRETSALTNALRVGAPIDDDVALVMPTSGTTGSPKGASLTAAALRTSASATHARLGGTGQWLLALPAHHIAGHAGAGPQHRLGHNGIARFEPVDRFGDPSLLAHRGQDYH